MLEFLNVVIQFVQIQCLFGQIHKLSRNIFRTNIMYLKASTSVKISTVLREK